MEKNSHNKHLTLIVFAFTLGRSQGSTPKSVHAEVHRLGEVRIHNGAPSITGPDDATREILNRAFERVRAEGVEFTWCKVDKTGSSIRLSRLLGAHEKGYAVALSEKLNEILTRVRYRYKGMPVRVATQREFDILMRQWHPKRFAPQ